MQVGGRERLGVLAHMENTWFHVDTTAGSFRVEFTDGRRDGIPVLGAEDPRDPLVRLSVYGPDGIVRASVPGCSTMTLIAHALIHRRIARLVCFLFVCVCVCVRVCVCVCVCV